MAVRSTRLLSAPADRYSLVLPKALALASPMGGLEMSTTTTKTSLRRLKITQCHSGLGAFLFLKIHLS
jgi:hypothetical protein